MSAIKPSLSLKLVFPIFAGYLVLYILGMHYHELWLDESQHFLMGRDSDSLSSLYWNMRYDGHPRLWNGLIWLVTHFITKSYIGMQVLHLCIAAATTFIFLRYAPFSLLMKLLILSGYYFIFEYTVISRNYAPGILVLFIVCILLADPRKYLIWIGALLFVLCNTHLFFAFTAVGVFFYLAVEFGPRQWLSGKFLLFSALFLVGFALVVVQTRTPQEENFHHIHPEEWLTGKNLSFAAFGLIRGWLPIPQIRGGHFWNTFWLNGDHIGGVAELLLFLFFLFLPALVFGWDKKVLLFYYTPLAFLIAFFIVTQDTGTRYFGMAYIYFLAASWVASRKEGSVFSKQVLFRRPVAGKFLLVSLYVVLLVQIGVGLIALEQDITRPFSQSKNTVDYLQREHLDKQPVVMDGYSAGPMISAYLGKKIYYLSTASEGSFVIWRTSYWPKPRPGIAEEIMGSSFLLGLDNFTLVTNRKLDVTAIKAGTKNFQVVPMKEFLNSILGEDYHVYTVRSF